jgi:hypothetical protein
MSKTELTIDDRIKILNKVRDKLIMKKNIIKKSGWGYGLCHLLRDEFYNYKIKYSEFEVENVFPHFKYENAIGFNMKLGAFKDTYWWSIYPYDFDNRIKFVEWMIKKMQEDEKSVQK